MLTTKSTATAVALVFALMIAGGSAGLSAATLTMNTQLSGKNEVPTNDSKAAGQARVTYDTTTKKLSWRVTYRGLMPMAGHFHGPAAAGVNAGVVVPFTGVDKSPIVGSATLTEAQASDLLAGKWYVNLHTTAFGGGEIRGQVVPPPPRTASRSSTRTTRNMQEQARTKALNEQQVPR